MIGFVVSQDTIYECDLTLQSDGSVKVYRCYNSILLGSVFQANEWFSTKDAAYHKLERMMEKYVRECQEKIDTLDTFASADLAFYEGLRDQCKTNLGKIRNMDASFIRRLQP